MLQKGYYSGKSENEILNDLGCEGCMPQRIVEPPGSRYDRHLCCDDIIIGKVLRARSSGPIRMRTGFRSRSTS